MFDFDKAKDMTNTAEFIIQHLSMESKYLDSVIDSSLEMQLILREGRSTPGDPDVPRMRDEATANGSLQAERHHRMKKKLDKLKGEIAREFLPVLEGRKKLVEVLGSIDPTQTGTPSVTSLALRVEEPYRSELKKLRSEIRSKLNQVQSISMGSQALLIYTLDFYNRLLTGLSQDYRQSNYYNSMGQTQNQFAGSLIKTNC